MELRDGSTGFYFAGTYEEREASCTLAPRLDDERLSRTTFKPTAGGTRGTTLFDAEASNPIEMQRAGWRAILDDDRTYAGRGDDGGR